MPPRAHPLLRLLVLTLLALAAQAASASDSVTAWLGHTTTLVLPATEKQAVAPRLANPDIATLIPLRSAERHGEAGLQRVRLTPLQTGTTTLHLGDRDLTLHVKPTPRPSMRADAVSRLDATPLILTPSPHAVLWGNITVAAQVPRPTDPADALMPPRVSATLNGTPLQPTGSTTTSRNTQHTFVIPCDRMAEGVAVLRVTAEGEAGSFSTAHPVNIRRGNGGVHVVEAEATAQTARPRRFGGTERLTVRERDDASGGGAVFLPSPKNGASVWTEVREPRWVQAVVAGFGAPAGDAYPAVGLSIDADDVPVRRGPVAGDAPHRTALGPPIRLDPPPSDRVDAVVDGFAWRDGHRLLTFSLSNDFYAGKRNDRNLLLDRVELMSLDGPPASMQEPADVGDHDAPPTLRHAALRSAPAWVTVPPPHAAPGDATFEAQVVPADGDAGATALTLHLNGRAVSNPVPSQRAAFVVPAESLQPGLNEAYVEATSIEGVRTRSATWRWQTDSQHAHQVTDDPSVHVFAADDPAWRTGRGAKGLQLERGNRNDRERVLALNSGGHIELPLPPGLGGAWTVSVRARGDAFEGAPELHVEHVTREGRTTDLGRLRFWNALRVDALSDLQLDPEQPGFLRLHFTNDHYVNGIGDRNLAVHSIILTRRNSAGDASPPTLQALPTAPDTDGRRVAAGNLLPLLLRLGDDRGVRQVRVALPDLPPEWWPLPEQPLDVQPLLLPITGLAPGDHTVRLEAVDAAGQRSAPVAVPFTVPAPGDAAATARHFDLTLRLLDRFAMGPDDAALRDVLRLGARGWIDAHLDTRDPGRELQVAARWAAAAGIHGGDLGAQQPLRLRLLRFLLHTPDPVNARLALFLDNHFSTDTNKAGDPRRHDAILGWLGATDLPFGHLLQQSATSAAMLRYLDQNRSFKGRLNENYAREVMELHTLGVHGGYSQADVTALASLLTGWSSAPVSPALGFNRRPPHTATFLASRHDPAPQRLLGFAFPEPDEARRDAARDRAEAALELLAGHPATARYICTKLHDHHLQPGTLTEPRLQRLTDTFTRAGGRLRPVVRELALMLVEDHERLDPAGFAQLHPPRLTHPLQHGLRLQRRLGDGNPGRLNNLTRASGATVLNRDTPDGYPEADAAYADSNGIMNRWAHAEDLRWLVKDRLPWSLRKKHADGYAADLRDARFIDALAAAVLARPLQPATRGALLDAAAGLLVEEREDALIRLVLQSPDASLR